MSIRGNVFATYFSHIYTVLIGIVVVPIYISYMGVEAYGLIGFFSMLQACFQLLDIGLTPTISRETARYCGKAVDPLTLRHLFRAFEIFFYGIAILGCLCIFIEAEAIATSWLNIGLLPLEQVVLSIQLMAFIISLRWVAGLYRGAINGFEQLIWLGKVNVFIATVRFGFVIVIFEAIGSEPQYFFIYQFLIACIETGLLACKTYQLMPKISPPRRIAWSLSPLRGVMNFSLSMAFASVLWIVLTQSDKLLLSRLLALHDYAYITLAVLVASSITIITGPVNSVIIPRLIRLNAEGEEVKLYKLYHHTTQLVTVVVAPLSLMLAFFAQPLLFIWTNNADTAVKVAPMLRLYALGNGVLAFSAFPYYLQLAKGNLRLHILGSVFFLIFLLPSILFATTHLGAVGAGWAWLFTNIIYFLVWVPFVHQHFAKDLHFRWLIEDILPVIIFSTFICLAVYYWMPLSNSRFISGITLFMAGCIVVALSILASKDLRKIACSYFMCKCRRYFLIK